MNGWKFKTSFTEEVNSRMAHLTAEPIIGEIDEKIREMTSDLHYKIATAETQWVLMLTPYHMLNTLKDQIENEIERRQKESQELLGSKAESRVAE